MSSPKLVRIGIIAKHYGVSTQCIRKWNKDGKLESIRTKGGTRLFDISKLVKDETISDKAKIFYCRVSSLKQKPDLERQTELAKEKYPEHEIISDVGSGLNWKRKGLKKILAKSLRGEISEIVIFHKDRLCRFGYEILEYILGLHNTNLIVHEPDDKIVKSKIEELSEDLLAITHIFSCSYYGSRRYELTENVEKSDSKPKIIRKRKQASKVKFLSN
jgi:putative resolvase